MRPKIKELMDRLVQQKIGRCLAISKFSMEEDFSAMSPDERIQFDVRFQPQYAGGSVDRLEKSQQVSAVQEILAVKWADKYLVYRDPAGNATYLQRDRETNTVKEIALEELQRQVARAFSGGPLDCKASEAREHACGWADRVEALRELPPSFNWKGHPELTFNRFDFEVAEMPTPLFDDFLSRIETNREAFMAFLWSLFVHDDRGQQYLWIVGEGQDGKGSVVRLLRKLLQDAFVALDAKDKYWLASCVGKRLGAFNDMVDVTFPMRSQFKQVTGQDPVNIEQKYKKSYSTVLDTKFIFTTNKELQITGQTSDIRRCILVRMVKNPHRPRTDYEDKLWEERAGILFKCQKVYGKMMQEHGAIFVDQEAARDLAEVSELKFQVMFEKQFVVDHQSWMTREAVRRHLIDSRGSPISNHEHSEFKEWMKRAHGITEKKIAEDGKALKVYLGLALFDTHPTTGGRHIRRNVK